MKQKVMDFIMQNSIDNPIYLEKIKDRLDSQENLSLFTPWGPKYTYLETGTQLGQPEKQTLQELSEFVTFLKENGYNPQLNVMFADTYGTDINGLPKKEVLDYFNNLDAQIQNIDSVQGVWWSELKDCERYWDLKSSVESNFFDYISKDEFRENVRTAIKFGGGIESARTYSIERIVEGMLIEEMYKPIKVSLVKPEKDVLDGPLARIYIIENRKPWMKCG
ncbi:MAG: hypothetical protein MAG795_00911 [Candidatus Woesearchaeota archaeon]|nr:hypothetical protein [Candidatus Woesearchaeota archaeon]